MKEIERPVVFLDIDGVLNCSKDFDAEDKIFGPGLVLCDKKVERFLKLKEEFNLIVVLSSTWRLYDKCRQCLVSRGISWDSVTGESQISNTRASEIFNWLHTNKKLESLFIILDDDGSPQLDSSLKKRHIYTSFSEGFTEEKFEEARKLLLELTER